MFYLVIFHNFLVIFIFSYFWFMFLFLSFISFGIIILFSILAIWSLYGLVLLFLVSDDSASWCLNSPLFFEFFCAHINQNFICEKAWKPELNVIFIFETWVECDFVCFCWMAETLPTKINLKFLDSRAVFFLMHR